MSTRMIKFKGDLNGSCGISGPCKEDEDCMSFAQRPNLAITCLPKNFEGLDTLVSKNNNMVIVIWVLLAVIVILIFFNFYIFYRRRGSHKRLSNDI
ncbi:unnamed protein product [Bursaphelenchus xylophilus]|uniref:(pine wood nematode) hypothetical protein n=1 Tax=Bursaphelenchus xylophilus TaxID=6326 RepID=A0A811JZ42_BURXY|nr:unnamed protein product [Bursaphelenchus xylophilus]CAG9081167.1 unnamed protein product [Bursaphelenchus xylophilus]